jgi:hypothetical protein
MLIEIFERRSFDTNRKSIVYILECEACGKCNEGSKSRYERSTMHFCDNKCRGRYKREHPETCQSAIEAMNSQESRAKAKETISSLVSEGKWKHWLGKHHTEDTRKRLSDVSKGEKRAGKNNGMFGRNHSEESRSKMSEKKSTAILESRFKSYGTRNKKGWYISTKTSKSHFFRSSWEEAVMKYLDSCDGVLTWHYESVRIPYFYSGNKRWYVPDFIIDFWSGETEMWEVKPKEFHLAERTIRTSVAGKKYCAEHDICAYVLLDKDSLNHRGII